MISEKKNDELVPIVCTNLKKEEISLLGFSLPFDFFATFKNKHHVN